MTFPVYLLIFCISLKEMPNNYKIQQFGISFKLIQNIKRYTRNVIFIQSIVVYSEYISIVEMKGIPLIISTVKYIFSVTLRNN